MSEQNNKDLLTLKEIMVRDVVTITKDKYVSKAAEIMAEKNIGSLVVMENDNIIGIITERDLLRKAIGKGLDLKTVTVGQIMSTPVITSSSELSIIDASELLAENNIKKLPVVDDNRLVGIVTEKDIANAMRLHLLKITPVKEAFVGTTQRYKFEPGFSYMIKEEKPIKSFEMFMDKITQGAQGLCITRIYPEKVRAEYGLEKTPILWLTQSKTDHRSVSPYSFSELSIMISDFINKADDCIILLDGISYLIAHNGYEQTLHFIQHIRDKVSAHGAHLIIPISERTLHEKEMKLLEQEVDIIISELELEKKEIKALEEENKP